MWGECAKGENNSFFEEFIGDLIIETTMKVVEVESGVGILLPEHFGNYGVLEFGIVGDPLVTKFSHFLDATFMLPLE